jgi:hypothetical protein
MTSDQLASAACNLAYGLGIPAKFRDGRIYQNGRCSMNDQQPPHPVPGIATGYPSPSRSVSVCERIIKGAAAAASRLQGAGDIAECSSESSANRSHHDDGRDCDERRY